MKIIIEQKSIKLLTSFSVNIITGLNVKVV